MYTLMIDGICVGCVAISAGSSHPEKESDLQLSNMLSK